jgi:hypothetical protein
MIVWSPALPPALLAIAVVAVAAALWWSRRRLRTRVGHHRLWWPRLALGLLLLCALAGPRWRVSGLRPPSGSLAILVDTSSSMDLKDGRRDSRLDRARHLAVRLRSAAPSGLGVEVIACDTRVRATLADDLPAGERPGDPAAILAGLASEPRLSGRAGLVLLSDGGDEPLAVAQPPACPLWIVGFGPAAGVTPDNVALAALDLPASAEVDSAVPIAVEVASSGAPAFFAKLGAVLVVLEEGDGSGAWREVGRQTLDLRSGRARAAFTRQWAAPTAVRLRAVAATQDGEASALDNRRETALEVRQRGLHVLYFTREIGSEFRTLRQELGRDPGLTFTALLRTVASERLGDRYSLLGERLEGDAVLDRGFPSDPAGLARYGVIILGAFDAQAWRPAEAEALRRHIEAGAGVIVLAGDTCAAGGALAALSPCPALGGLDRGVFSLSVPAGANGHAVAEGLPALFAGSSVGTLARLGPTRPAAVVVLAAGSQPVVAVQPYGRGRSALVASNTLWRLAGPGPAGEGYGRLWRQLVRWCAGTADEGGDLRLRWDKDRYRPGEEAVVTILPTAEARLAVVANLTAPGGAPQAVALEPSPDDGPGALRARLRLGERGTWRFRVEGRRDGAAGEATVAERLLQVAPRQGEGARLVPDHAALARAAEACGGDYAAEDAADDLVAQISARLAGAPVVIERAPLQTPWLLLLVLALLIAEWSLRRKAGIV